MMTMGTRPSFIPHQLQMRNNPSTAVPPLPMPPGLPHMMSPPGVPGLPMTLSQMPPLPQPVQQVSAVISKPPTVYSAPPVRFTKTTEHLENTTRSDSPILSQDTFQINTDVATNESSQSLQGPYLPMPVQTTDNIKDDKTKDKPEKRKKKFVRTAAGTVWEDESLVDWDPNDFRIFCGDLGNEVTDELLTRVFGKYPSFLKAKVVRDKRTNKTKGFGFVSFRDPNDFVAAMREMNGKYVGNRPIKLRKSSWRDRNIEMVKKKQKEKERLGLR
ncbi:RNA-binding protein 42-like [Saccoglossus kowalevskii]|uniref:RNA-binding protein 42 n=1 Tax=Saccoglossus kowalevskii TaxID=10224 RepID=A0ABM0MIJ4_SACKO|nr:PREDICTED: RNA-binding protein 42-like [Saccoglossus kowalevskii]